MLTSLPGLETANLTTVEDWIVAIGIFVFFILLAVGARFFMGRLLPLITHRTKTALDDLIVQALAVPVVMALVVLGLYLAIVRLPLELYATTYDKAFIVTAIVLTTLTVVRLGNAFVTWYTVEVAHRTSTNIDDKLLPVMRRVGSIVLWGIGTMLILDELHVNISPLIASLGIGGLAIAIAVQPTLSNFMAGTYVISDAVIRKGHYIMLDSGQEGMVEDIGWRTTKIRHWQGNVIILPNSKLAEAIVIDFEALEVAKTFRIECGVSYKSDLEKVEKVALEVAREVQRRVPEGAKDFEPEVRFKQFGESNIIFAVVLKAIDRLSQYELKHEFIKALHKRFQVEGITIEYPVRRLYYPETPESSPAKKLTKRP